MEAIDDAKRETLFGTGYGRPPKAHRFIKGRSGNPKGRPKAASLPPDAPSSNALILEEGNRLLKVQEQGATSYVTAFKAVLRSHLQTAVKGNAYAQRIFIDRFQQAEAAMRRETAAEVERWTGHRDTLRQLFKLAEERGEPPPKLLPHPDDVVIDRERGVRFVGPWDEQSAASLEVTLKMRDVLLVQDAWDDRHGRGEGEFNQTVAGLMATMLNDNVPARFRLSEVEVVTRLSRLHGTTKRQLRKMLHRGFRDLGQRWRPDVMFPSIVTFVQTWERLWAAYRAVEEEP